MHRRQFLAVSTAAAALAGCATTSNGSTAPAVSTPASSNPLLKPWPTGAFDGVAPFDIVKVSDFSEALELSLAERKREIDAIANNMAPPTFANTVQALERSGATFGRVASLFFTWSSSMSDDAFQKVEAEWTPRLSAANSEITLNAPLFRRVDAVMNSPAKARLTPEQQRLLWRQHNNFVLAGAKVSEADKPRLAAVDQQLASLYTAFQQKVLADENAWTVISSQADLAGLPDDLIAAFKAAADDKKVTGWAVVNTRSMVDPFLTYASNRSLREQVWKKFKGRGDNGDANDTNATIAAIMPLRAEKGRLLGFPTFAHWKLADKMAATPDRAQALMERVWAPTKVRIAEEVRDMQAIADQEGARLTIEPWDYLYYGEKVRKAKFDLDQNELKPYFELNKMIEASHYMAKRLYGLELKEVTGQVPVFHPEMRVWTVSEGSRFVGLFYGDYFARTGKGSGAWENAYRSQSNDGKRITPLVSNNNNFVKGAPGEPILISLDDAQTLFHEFGHALHDLLSNVTYDSLSGTNTATDFVEFPSQVHENWVLSDDVLDRYGRHYQTGAKMPQALLDKVKAARTFNQGYITGEYLISAIVDMDMHSTADGRIDPDRFEREDMARIGAPSTIAMRHRLPHFNHLFTGEGYAAGYYSYLWSDTMGSDAWEAFEETGDVWNPAVAARMKSMMAAGDTLDQTELYRRFRGRDPDIAALLKSRGLAS
jgi:peptidyl-dipeptidase Dcp